RKTYNLSGLVNSREIAALPKGQVVKVGGLVIRPHRPPTKSGRTVVFMSLEDEFGLVDVTVFEKTYQKYGKLLFGGSRIPLAVTGRVEHRGEATSLIAFKIEPLIQ
ncbi:MAG TPA: OB-fold nucleic acid binding domain-containing protein, partial [Bacillota bacterium]|nr:OB-fold nucleic acid binding domain-containing protein [Bacillota bacterium]